MRATILIVLAALLLLGMPQAVAQGAPPEVPTTITITGGAQATSQHLSAGQAVFDLSVPLQPNAQNTLTVTATDGRGRSAMVSDLTITQLALTDIVAAKVTSQRLTTEEIKQLVAAGTIDVSDPENFNVSMFDIVLTINDRPVSVRVPVVGDAEEPVATGEPLTIGCQGREKEPTTGKTILIPCGGGGGQPKIQIIPFEIDLGQVAPEMPPIPGVILIEGRIKTLKEFFTVNLLLMNVSSLFTLTDIMATLEVPAGALTTMAPAHGPIQLHDLPPGNEDSGQFIVRGDQIGIHTVTVHFGGAITGLGIATPVPFSGRASTDLEVKGPPTMDVTVEHPSSVEPDEAYTLKVNITNTSPDLPALFTSLELDVGAGAQLIDAKTGDPLPGPSARALGDILPGRTVSQSFTVLPSRRGPIGSCTAGATQNLSVSVVFTDDGGPDCDVGSYPSQWLDPSGRPTVRVIPPHNTTDVAVNSAITAVFSAPMQTDTITTGVPGATVRLSDPAGTLIGGELEFSILSGENTVAVFQPTALLADGTSYTLVVDPLIFDQEGVQLASGLISRFTTEPPPAVPDTEAPTASLVVEPPVSPSFIPQGTIVPMRVEATDNEGVMRVDLLLDGKLVDTRRPASAMHFLLDTSELVPDSSHSVTAVAVDAAGNTGEAATTLHMAPDTSPPTAEIEVATSVERGRLLSVTVRADDDGQVARVAMFVDDEVEPSLTDLLAPFQFSVQTAGLSVGTHQLQALVTDGAGNTATAMQTVEVIDDTEPPTVVIISPVPGTQAPLGQVVPVVAEIDDNVGIDQIQCFLDTETDPRATNFRSFMLDTTGLAEGEHTLRVEAQDVNGHSAEAPVTFALFTLPPDTTPPEAPNPALVAATPPVSGVSTVTGAAGAVEAGVWVELMNLQLLATARVLAAADGSFQVQIEAGGGERVSIVAVDLAGNRSDATELVIPVPPQLVSLAVSPASVTLNRTNTSQQLTVTGHWSDGSQAPITAGLSFVSIDRAIADVTPSGLVLPGQNGATTVQVEVAGVTPVDVPVTVAFLSIVAVNVTPSSVLLDIGLTQQLTVQAVFSDGSIEPFPDPVTFASDNAAVAEVNASGLITGMADGTTTITVTAAGFDSLAVPVTVARTPPTVAIVSPATGADVERGENVAVSVRADDANGGVSRITLTVTGETAFSDLRQIVPPASTTTQMFHFTVSGTVTVGGTITVSAQAEDDSGNTSADASIVLSVVDTAAPSVQVVEPAPRTPFNFGDTVMITVEATDTVGVTQIRYETTGALTFSGSQDISPAAPSASATFSFDIPFGVPDPDVTIHAFARDTDGNEGAGTPVPIIITDADITPPETIATAVADPGSEATTVVTYEVLAGLDDLDYVALYFRRNGIGTFNRYTDEAGGNPNGTFFPQTGATGTIVFDSTRMGGDGDYEFATVGVDIAGNREPLPEDDLGNVLADQAETFTAGTVWTVIDTPTVIGAGDTTYDDQNLRVVDTTVTLDGSHSFHNMELVQAAVLTHPETDLTTVYGIDIQAWTLAIDAASAIDVAARGYLGGQREGNDCTGQTVGNTDGSTYRSGGSYGGLGGAVEGTPNPVYGNLTAPADPGSGGSCGSGSVRGGNGGGSIQIQAINLISDGTISANGGAGRVGGGYRSGSGSGGMVNMTTSSLSGTGIIRANGGDGEVGGGGGRIAVRFIDIATMDTGLMQTLGGQGSYRLGGNGTVFLKGAQENNGTLVIDGQGATSSFSPLPIPPGYVFDHIILRNQARVVADDPVVVEHGSLQLLTGSILTHTLSSAAGLTIEAGRVEVDASSAIDVSARGYRGGLRDGNTICEGLTLGGVPGAAYRAGGSYGGAGGVVDGPGSNAAYGHPAAPVHLGSGGSCGSGSVRGGNGGGVIQITATEAVVVHGSIMADGGDGSVSGGYRSGSGSGGSITIDTPLLQGTGSIAANGGVGEVGGGGGRVAITYDYVGEPGNDLNGLYNITALGGHGSFRWGSAGTLLIKQRAQALYGDLYIDDNMTEATSSVETPLTHIGFGRIVDLTADTLTTDGLVKMVPNGLVGLEINPSLTQAETYTVVANTETAIVVETTGKPALTDIAAIGDVYGGVHRFDNVYFRRGGVLVLGDNLLVSDTLHIDDYGQLTHYGATLDFGSQLAVEVGRLEIAATGAIDVDGRGYLGGLRDGNNDCTGQTVGNTDGSTYRSAGSYGGLGGAIEGTPNPVYGSLSAPADLGSGGSCGSGSVRGGNGGGIIQITATEAVVVHGGIVANGGVGGGGYAGSGSGGSITIDTPLLEGTGSITANGGGGEVGGGGGRVAVLYDTLSLDQAHIQALGGQGSHRLGGNGSIFYKSSVQTYGDLVIDGLGQTTPDASSPLLSGYVFDHIILRNQARVVADDPVVVEHGSLQLLTGSLLTHTLSSEAGLTIAARRIEVDASSAIDVDARGYLGGYQEGNDNDCMGQTVGNTDGSTYRSAGSYGGLGGAVEGTPNPVYGSLTDPADLGSGGSCYSTSHPGGNGGGIIQITATEAVVVHGGIVANGGVGAGGYAGSGSGGSITIDTPLLEGTGSITANGGGGEVGGGGGRVAVLYDTLSLDQAHIQALGGQGSHRIGGNGSIFYKSSLQTYGDLVIDGLGQTTADASSPLLPGYVFDHIILRNQARVVADDPVVVEHGSLQLFTDSILTHTLSSPAGLTVAARRVEVDASSAINVDGRGYLGGYQGDNDCTGQTVGNTDGSTYRSAGSYGGLGGAVEGTANPVYGSLTAPADLGSGGSCGSSRRRGGNGGGWVTIQAGEMLVDGVISANGDRGVGALAGSGSGGTVHITTGTLAGTGIIRANGGSGEVGGGGGRVAVFYGTLTLDPAHIQALGGQGSSHDYIGSNGKIYLYQE